MAIDRKDDEADNTKAGKDGNANFAQEAAAGGLNPKTVGKTWAEIKKETEDELKPKKKKGWFR